MTQANPLPPIPPAGPDLGPPLDPLIFLIIVPAILIIAFYFPKNFLTGKPASSSEVMSGRSSAVNSKSNEEFAAVMRELLEEIRELRKEIKELREEMRE